MELVKNLARAVGRAASELGHKHRRTAELNRIRTVIRCEERAAEKEYLALGRYYYNTLRDKGNTVAEPHCRALDEIELRLDAALSQMQEAAARAAEGCSVGLIAGWDDEDGLCPPAVAEYEEIDLSDVECFDQEPALADGPAPEREKGGPEEGALPFEG